MQTFRVEWDKKNSREIARLGYIANTFAKKVQLIENERYAMDRLPLHLSLTNRAAIDI
jgi:alpha-D-ribose 1-methylphosphonate 5-phosphate C-P lyase